MGGTSGRRRYRRGAAATTRPRAGARALIPRAGVKIPRAPHRFAISPAEAIALQRRLAGRVEVRAPRGPLRRLAGVDCAFSADGALCLAAVVVYDLENGATLEQRSASAPLRFPYVPGLLSFREAPAMLAALRRLRATPDALLVDGHGFAHPRRFGIACHLGVLVGIPTLGVAKSRLVGEHALPGPRRGDAAPLLHERERIGTALRTREGSKPVYVSVGHRIDLESAQALVLAACAGHRLPEPTRLADRAVALLKRERAAAGAAGRRATARPRRTRAPAARR
jgi:deoxyribonuclease V